MALASGGIILAGSVGVGAGIGWWLDQRWGTDPWLAVVGVLLGSAAGFTELWRMVQRSGDDD
jgi:ATP synthase protein I